MGLRALGFRVESNLAPGNKVKIPFWGYDTFYGYIGCLRQGVGFRGYLFVQIYKICVCVYIDTYINK